MCGYNVQNISSVVEVNKYIYTRGCIEAITEIIERNMNLVAGVCLGSALVQVFIKFIKLWFVFQSVKISFISFFLII